jgi:hypothetical protein
MLGRVTTLFASRAADHLRRPSCGDPAVATLHLINKRPHIANNE